MVWLVTCYMKETTWVCVGGGGSAVNTGTGHVELLIPGNCGAITWNCGWCEWYLFATPHTAHHTAHTSTRTTHNAQRIRHVSWHYTRQVTAVSQRVGNTEGVNDTYYHHHHTTPPPPPPALK